jgi:hypothetical protein
MKFKDGIVVDELKQTLRTEPIFLVTEVIFGIVRAMEL